MKLKSFAITIIVLTIAPLIIQCNNLTNNRVKFNRVQWNTMDDLHAHSNRESMIEDLIEHHIIRGLTYHQLIDSLGEPENYGDKKDSLYYDIVVDYGYLDPKSGRYLAIGFNKDSIVTGFTVVKWKNRHANE